MGQIVGNVNLLAILVSAAVTFIIGMIWYSPALFGNAWAKLNKFSPKQMKKMQGDKGKMMSSMVFGFLSYLVMAYVLALIVDLANASTLMDGAVVGVLMWVGFVGTLMLGMVLWEQKPFQLYVINSSYPLVSLAVMGAILAVWV